MSLNLPFGIQPINALSNIDARYGPWASTGDSLTNTAGTRVTGLTVGVIENSSVVEYWFKDGIDDNDLIKKELGSSVGGINQTIQFNNNGVLSGCSCFLFDTFCQLKFYETILSANGGRQSIGSLGRGSVVNSACDFTVCGGGGGTIGGRGGSVYVKPGDSYTQPAANAHICGGGVSGTLAGNVYICGGAVCSDLEFLFCACGGDVYVQGGCGNKTCSGGNVYISGGTSTGGTQGNVYLISLPSKTSETCAVYIDSNGKLVTGVASSGSGSVNMSGSTVNGLTTYVDADTICAQPNLTFNGSSLKATGDICASTCVCSPIICSSSCVRISSAAIPMVFHQSDTGTYFRLVYDGNDIRYDFDTGAVQGNFSSHQTPLLMTRSGTTSLRYDGSPKLITTSTGVDVTGKVVTDTLQVETGAAAGCVLVSDASGNATWQTQTITNGVNGLSKSGNNIVLGGNLTGDTEINLSDNCFDLINQTPNILFRIDPTNEYINYNIVNNFNTFYSGKTCFQVGNLSPNKTTLLLDGDDAIFCLCSTNSGGIGANAALNLRSSGATITDLGTNGGIRYSADYSNNYVARSLVDKNYVDTCVGSAGGIVMSGSTANGLTTYVDANTICVEPNLTFDGSILGVTGNIVFNNGAARAICMSPTTTAVANSITIKGTDLSYYCDDIDPMCGGAINIVAGTGYNEDDSFVGCAYGGNINICAGMGCGDIPESTYGGHVNIYGGCATVLNTYGNEVIGGNVNLYSGFGEDTLGCVALYHYNTKRFSTSTIGTITTGVHYVTTYVCSPIVCGVTCAAAPITCGTTCVKTPKIRVNETNYASDVNIDAQFESTNNCEAVRIYGWSGSTTTNTALRVYNKGGTSTGGNCAIYADAYYSAGPSSNGRSHGIWAIAGNKTSQYNYGVIGQLLGTNDGAGIVGVLSGWSTTLPAGCWAGVFEGPTYLGGAVTGTSTICANTCLRSAFIYSTGAVCAAGVSCGVTCVQSPVVCGTTRVQSPIVCGSTCVQSPYLYATTGAGSPAILGCQTFQTTSGLAGVAGYTTSAGCGVLGHFNGTARAGVFGFCSSTLTYASTTHAGYFVGCVCIDDTQASGYGLKVDTCGCAVDWVATSDCRKKKNIIPIIGALSKIDCLCGVCYDFCNEESTPDMGLIAQDVLKVEPRLVTEGTPSPEEKEKYGIEDKVYALKYDKFAGLFVEAIKELKEQNICLQKQINELKNK